MKLLNQFTRQRMFKDDVDKLAILKAECLRHASDICRSCPAGFGKNAPTQCQLRREDVGYPRRCETPAEWNVPDSSVNYTKEDFQQVMAWYRNLMIYHPDRFEDLREYIGQEEGL